MHQISGLRQSYIFNSMVSDVEDVCKNLCAVFAVSINAKEVAGLMIHSASAKGGKGSVRIA